MQISRTLEQHVAVFGESGSGKTVMISSFYGATQEPYYRQGSLFNVVADDIGQGSRLHRNYLGMKNSATLPVVTTLSATSYAFSIKMNAEADAKVMKSKPFDAVRLVWHDYPGEWFEQGVSGPEEAQRRVDTFKSLLGSDVALLLVDGQRLQDNAGEEERYLKSLFSNIRNALLSLKDDLLEDGKPLVEFPRIWMVALSKSDLLPDVDVFKFRDLLVEKAHDDLADLRKVIGGLVQANEALSVGEDFVLLSSAKFETSKIEVTQRVGLDLVLPLATMLPFERHARWARMAHLPGKVAANLVEGAAAVAAVLIGRKLKVPGPLGQLLAFVGPALVAEAVKLAGEKLADTNQTALAKNDYVTAVISQFRMDLDKGEEEHTLLRSLR